MGPEVGDWNVLVTQSCLTLCNPMDCSPQDSSVHGILQLRILERVAIPFSRGSSQPRDQILVSFIAGRFFIAAAMNPTMGDCCGTNKTKAPYHFMLYVVLCHPSETSAPGHRSGV